MQHRSDKLAEPLFTPSLHRVEAHLASTQNSINHLPSPRLQHLAEKFQSSSRPIASMSLPVPQPAPPRSPQVDESTSSESRQAHWAAQHSCTESAASATARTQSSPNTPLQQRTRIITKQPQLLHLLRWNLPEASNRAIHESTVAIFACWLKQKC